MSVVPFLPAQPTAAGPAAGRPADAGQGSPGFLEALAAAMGAAAPTGTTPAAPAAAGTALVVPVAASGGLPGGLPGAVPGALPGAVPVAAPEGAPTAALPGTAPATGHVATAPATAPVHGSPVAGAGAVLAESGLPGTRVGTSGTASPDFRGVDSGAAAAPVRTALPTMPAATTATTPTSPTTPATPTTPTTPTGARPPATDGTGPAESATGPVSAPQISQLDAPEVPTRVPGSPDSVGRAVVQQVFPEVTRLTTSGNGAHRITINLQPAQLGEVRVTLVVRDGAVTVSLGGEAGNSAVQHALSSGTSELRRMLELAGATEARIFVRDAQASAPLSPAPASGQAHADTTGEPGTPGRDDRSRDQSGQPDQPGEHRRHQPGPSGTTPAAVPTSGTDHAPPETPGRLDRSL